MQVWRPTQVGVDMDQARRRLSNSHIYSLLKTRPCVSTGSIQATCVRRCTRRLSQVRTSVIVHCRKRVCLDCWSCLQESMPVGVMQPVRYSKAYEVLHGSNNI